MTDRQPTGWATYPHDHRHIVVFGPKGPTLMGEMWWPVTANYDAETDTTRVGFSLIAPEA